MPELGPLSQINPGEVLGEGLTMNALLASRASQILTVGGTVRSSGDNAVGALVQGLNGQQIVIAPGGVVNVDNALRGKAIATWGAEAPALTNNGRLTVEAVIDGYGANLNGQGAAHVNTGQIQAIVLQRAYGVAISGGHANFSNSGTVTAEGFHSAAVTLSGSSVTFHNAETGVIRATSTGLDGTGTATALTILGNTAHAVGSVTNAGLIEGRTAVSWTRDTSGAVGLVSEREFINEATGVLRGRVFGGSDPNKLTNRGLIEGDVGLGAGDDIYNGAGGRATDIIQGNEGADTLLGGDVFDYLHGNQGDDSLSGGLGGDWVVGGQGSDRLYGDADADIVLGNLENDSVFGGAGDDVVRGGQGNDSISGGDGADFVAGDRGDDTLSGGAGADVFHSFGDAGLDRIVDFNRAEGDVLNLLAGSTYTTAQSGADVVVTLAGGGRVVLAGVQLSSLTGDWLTVG